jgi:hypothetical protein
MMRSNKRKKKKRKKKQNGEGKFPLYASMNLYTIRKSGVGQKFTVAGETRVACVRLGVESSKFEAFCLCSLCCCDEEPPFDVVVEDDVDEELEAFCCP